MINSRCSVLMDKRIRCDEHVVQMKLETHVREDDDIMQRVLAQKIRSITI